MPLLAQDALVAATASLPGSAVTVTSSLIDTGNVDGDNMPGRVQYKLTAPILTATQLGSGSSVTYTIYTSPNSDASSAVAKYVVPTVQTGTSSGDLTGFTFHFALPTTAKQYIYFTAAGAGGVAASASSASLVALF